MDNKLPPAPPYQPPAEAYHLQAPQAPATHAHAATHTHQATNGWSNSFWSCCSPFKTCCCACWCPCVLFGRTHDRLNNPADQNPDGCNLMCAAWTCLAYVGCSCILQTIQRSKMRDQYGVKGSTFGDFCASCCCPCCALVQEEKESVHRTRLAAGYQQPQPMMYP